MRFNETTIRVLVRKNYSECFDFYTEKIGLVAIWGDRNGPYTSFAVSKDAPPCFAIFAGANMSMFQGYMQPESSAQPDTVTAGDSFGGFRWGLSASEGRRGAVFG